MHWKLIKKMSLILLVELIRSLETVAERLVSFQIPCKVVSLSNGLIWSKSGSFSVSQIV